MTKYKPAKMPNLIIDIGNTRVKYAVMREHETLAECATAEFSVEAACELIAPYEPKIRRAIVSSTRSDGTLEARLLCEAGIDTLCFTADTAVPIGNDYLTPATLGRDRLAAAVGADALYPGRSMLLVDFGTAITCDLVVDRRFLGGFISPGMRLRLRALHDYTARLPLVVPPDEELPWGRTTDQAVGQGVVWGIVGEIEGHMARFEAEFENLLIIFTGGDAKYFVKRIKNTIFADCDLVMLGLNRILLHHIHAEQ